jgi:hypothetical protein
MAGTHGDERLETISQAEAEGGTATRRRIWTALRVAQAIAAYGGPIGAHAGSHQNGGADEVNVAGLSGLLADPQTPAAHEATHREGAADTIPLDKLGEPSNNTDLDVDDARHGLCPRSPGDANLFLNGIGGYSLPPGSGGGEANTGSNVGSSGVGPFDGKVGVDLTFRNIAAATGRIQVSLNVANKDIEIDVVLANLPLDQIGEPSDTTNLDTSTVRHGLCPKLSGNTLHFLRGDGVFALAVATPVNHAPTHQDGGSDEINVGGLSGLLADPQTPAAHASTHEPGGADELALVLAAQELEVPVWNDSGDQIDKGEAVYISGWSIPETLATVALAKANAAGTMPALGLVKANIADGAAGVVVVAGELSGIDTSGFAVGAAVFVSEATAGALGTRPGGPHLVQKIGIVLRSNPAVGIVSISGAGRVNDIPNFSASGKIWQGGAGGTPVEVDLLAGFPPFETFAAGEFYDAKSSGVCTDGFSTQPIVDGQMYWHQFRVRSANAKTFDRIGLEKTAGSGTPGRQIRLGIYTDSGNRPGDLVANSDSGAIAFDANGFAFADLSPAVSLAPGVYWLAVLYDGQGSGATVRSFANVEGETLGYPSGTDVNEYQQVEATVAFGALPDPAPAVTLDTTNALRILLRAD